MPLSRKRGMAVLVAIVIVSVLALVYLYRSGRLVNYGFWVAASQFLLVVLGAATALLNEWVQKHKLLTLGIFALIGLACFVVTVKQSDQSAAEGKELVAKLDRIEAAVSQPSPDKNQIIAEIRDARSAITSQSAHNTALGNQNAPIGSVQHPTPSPNLLDDRRQRTLTSQQRQAIESALGKAPDWMKQRPLSIVRMDPGDMEIGRYSLDIEGVLKSDGWNVALEVEPSRLHVSVLRRGYTGIVLLANQDSDFSTGRAQFLAQAFAAAGVPVILDTGQTMGRDCALLIGKK